MRAARAGSSAFGYRYHRSDILDRIQAEDHGQLDEQHDHWVNASRAFFTSEDICRDGARTGGGVGFLFVLFGVQGLCKARQIAMVGSRRLVLVAILSLLCASCGDDSKAPRDPGYASLLESAHLNLELRNKKVITDFSEGLDFDDGQRAFFSALSDSLSRYVQDMRGIDAPDPLEDVHDDLIHSAKAVETEIAETLRTIGTPETEPEALGGLERKFSAIREMVASCKLLKMRSTAELSCEELFGLP